jgi:hypothetical protein
MKIMATFDRSTPESMPPDVVSAHLAHPEHVRRLREADGH